jgi:lipoate-protein ligase A
VVGYANKTAVEVNLPACEKLGAPVLRRCTGGGTVVQLPGCLNYSVILRIDSYPLLSGIPGTNKLVMERIRQAVQSLVSEPVAQEGHTDLAILGKKFCGNAQRRRKNWLIFHGCFLLNCDLGLIAQLLQMPSKQPEYRRGRSHVDFLRNLGVNEGLLKAALVEEWSAASALRQIPLDMIQRHVSEHYSQHSWNFKF